MGPVEINFAAKDLKNAAKLEEQIVKQMEVIGFQFKEFKATPVGNKVNVTLSLVRKKN